MLLVTGDSTSFLLFCMKLIRSSNENLTRYHYMYCHSLSSLVLWFAIFCSFLQFIKWESSSTASNVWALCFSNNDLCPLCISVTNERESDIRTEASGAHSCAACARSADAASAILTCVFDFSSRHCSRCDASSSFKC